MSSSVEPLFAETSSDAHQKRRWWQFRLLTLHFFVTVCAVALGWFNYELRKLRRIEAAVDAVANLGGTVAYCQPGVPNRCRQDGNWFAGVLGFDTREVTYVGLARSQTADEALSHLTEFHELRVLLLDESSVTDNGMSHLAGLTNLQNLTFDNTQIGDDGVQHLSGMKLMSRLSLGCTQVGDNGMKHLRAMTQLKELTIDNSQVSDVGLTNLARLSRLQSLDLGGGRMTREGVAELQKALPDCEINWIELKDE